VLAASTAVVVSGGYRAVSRVALVLALLLVTVTAVAAGRVFDSGGEAVTGLVPTVPGNLDVPFLLPWIGTILAGSMGIVWFSYWTATRGYGGTSPQASAGERTEDESPPEETPEQLRGERLTDWFRTLSNTAVVGVATGTLIITAFLVLGAELLRPQGIVPSGTDVAKDLTRLLSEVWGQLGHWLMVAAIVVALGGSVLANQDGWSRSFADITLLLRPPAWVLRPLRHRPDSMALRRAVKVAFAVVVTGLLPALVVVVVRDPVTIMSASGVIATIHTPFIVLTTLAVNRRIPGPLRPGAVSTGLLGLAGLFYSGFAVLYFADLVGMFGG
jgi:hypothetical protein